ncbi:MAG: ribonuclease H-like domain-containing protein [Chitinophagaceae bacterium]|nr:ribonuclease H-like domain-containing protein [Chitinophagaceae bacterium]
MADQNPYNLLHLLLLDIETVPQFASFEELPEPWKLLWTDKISKTMPENFSAEEWYVQRAGIQAEFGKIICISTGFFYYDTAGRLCFRLKSYNHADEKILLRQLVEKLESFHQAVPAFHFTGHNIKEFDIPYISRRLLINQMPLPGFMQFSGRKPWETNLIDTMQLWKFGDYKNYTSLKLLATCLGIETPKDDIDGSKVKEVYYAEKNIERITTYCQKVVVTVAQIILRFLNKPLLPAENVFVAE